jgi:8-oxo-dGTP diphosphatase
MKLATLVYVRRAGETLMLHRIRKANDMHAGKWNGLGGKLEAGESPEACAIREVLEESGLAIRAPRLCGVLTFPAFANDEDWYAFVFVANEISGELIDSNEGVLEWIPDERLLDLPLWPGDRIFIPWLNEPGFFSASFSYRDGNLDDWSGVRYLAGGAIVALNANTPDSKMMTGTNATPAASELENEPAAVPSGFDDQICWLCGGETVKRNCKIVCLQCGFLRDCSDP